MTILIRILAAAAACSLVLAGPASGCESGRCENNAAAAEPKPLGAKPLKLNAFMRTPVATSATRTVKKKSGEHAKVAVKRRAKPRVAAAPRVTPATISPAAAQAFAAYELARVRVVTPEEADGARNLADAAANSAAPVGLDLVQVVSAEEVNDIDRKADTPAAVSLDALSRNLAVAAADPRPAGETWAQRILMVFGGAFAGVAALVRMLLG